MARISMKGPGRIEEISAILKERIPECGWTCELLDRVSRCGAEMLVFEKHFMRSGNSSASLSIMISAQEGGVIVDSVGSGAKAGLFDFTWGVEEDFAAEVANVLEPMGFVVFERDDTQIAEDYEPVSLSELGAGKSAEKEEAPQEAEWVQLGKEEKKGLFGRKRNKPDWEY
ncbi:MAG: hypothetical protein E7420_06800 [Ruminococcaceae bacterium]|nr:hypothetical protein [Oscillospiraceae bacterium]